MLLAQLFIVMFWSELVLFTFFSFLIPSSLLGFKRHGKPENQNWPPSKPAVLLFIFVLLLLVFKNVLLGCF